MDNLLLKEDFLTELNYIRFFIGLVILLLLVYLIKKNYLNHSYSNDNKINFAETLIPFSLSMVLIVSVIKTSLALSLGLVGALSIIRFRNAIKETEQIISLLIVLAVSIAIAAEKEILAIIVALIYILINRKSSENNKLQRKKYLLVSFKSNKEVKIQDVELMQINRFYKTLDGMYTVEYLFDSNENLDDIITNLRKKLKVDLEYEIN